MAKKKTLKDKILKMYKKNVSAGRIYGEFIKNKTEIEKREAIEIFIELATTDNRDMLIRAKALAILGFFKSMSCGEGVEEFYEDGSIICGYRNITDVIEDNCKEVISILESSEKIDLNEDFLVFADKKNRGTFYKRDVTGDLSDLKADTVVLADILHHVTPNHQKLIENAIKCAQKKVIISACYEKEEGPFKQISEFIGRRIIDNDGLNEQREGAGWLKLDELLQFLETNGATNFQKVLSHIHCEINI